MTKNYNRGKKYIELTAALFASACLFCACGNDKELPTASYSYGPELGLASGNVDLSSDSPDINISDIKSPVGENIDFLSGVTVINEEDYEDYYNENLNPKKDKYTKNRFGFFRNFRKK